MPAERPRILLLCDPRCGFQATYSASLLKRELNLPAMSLQPRMIPTLRRLRSDARQYDSIHAVGIRALTAAALGSRLPLVFTPDDELTPRNLRWLRGLIRYRRISVLCSSVQQQSRFVARGINPDHCRVTPPGVDFSQLPAKRDPDLRRALGFTDSDRVMLLVGDSTRASGHADALWAAAILHVLDPKYKVLAWRCALRTASLIHFARSQNHQTLIRVADSTRGRSVGFETLFTAADIALITPTGPVAPVPIAIAMASGVPIIATTAGELLQDNDTALIAQPNSPRALAQRILDAEQNPLEARALSDRARVKAGVLFSPVHFVEAHREIYHQFTAAAP